MSTEYDCCCKDVLNKKMLNCYICVLLGSWDVKELSAPENWQDEDIDMLVPYLISVHLLYDIAKARNQQSVLILPPHGKSHMFKQNLASPFLLPL